ncbi:LPS translocon maturation chaperone LptM [Desulfonema magnum]
MKIFNHFSKSLILIIVVSFLCGCGKKGPPVPPQQISLPVVNHVKTH